MWRYSWLDSIPCSITLFQLALNFWLAATWQTRPLLHNLLFLPLCLFLFCYNGLVASHNFVHTPWFKLSWLNRLYLMLNSINIGLPQAHYAHEHLLHHRYNNDRPDAYGHTQDPTSTFAGGKNNQHEGMLSYCFLGPFHLDLLGSFREICQRGGTGQLALELIACCLGFMAYALLSWQYVVLMLVPTLYLGWVLEHIENYYEHFGGEPELRYANSTSYYGRLYNWLFCNEGYHQEHHLRPNMHWLKRPQNHQELAAKLAQVDRVILRLPPCLAWLEHRRLAERWATKPLQARILPKARLDDSLAERIAS
ncbi:MAG: fatty acid desaturase family protein [Elainella sp.]